MKRLLKSTLTRLGYRVEGTRHTPRHLLAPECLRTITFDDVISRRMFDVGPELHFIQVGAFDGTTADPLRKYIGTCKWSGILVEPQARYAAQLRDLYRDNDRIVVLEAAVDAKPGPRVLFTVRSESAPSWGRGLASFDRESIVKHRDLIPGLDQLIAPVTVNCVSFNHVIDLLASERLDLLQLDAEGADAYLLSLFPFTRLKPAIIHWEIKHADKVTREECFDRLVAAGYRLAPSGGEDMLGVLF